MKVCITGASGYLGNKLAHTLAARGIQVHALARSISAGAVLQHPNIIIHEGDILQKDSLSKAMKGCNQVYHTAARVGVWAKDPSEFYQVNVEGTRNVLDAAVASGVEKFVFTSTCGVIGPTPGKPLDETDQRSIGFEIDYDLSKKKAEDLVLEYARNQIHALIVSPSKIFGPGNVSHSLTANAIIDAFLKKGIAFIPQPGTYQVCFAFLDDIVEGHILAMEKGRSGEKYILGGTNISYYAFFNRIRLLSAGKKYILSVPKPVIKGWAYMQVLNHQLTCRPIRFTVSSVDHLFSNYIFSSEKAIRELGYRITPLEEALKKTIQFLNKEKV